MTDDPATERGMLIGVKSMTSQLAVHHPTDGVNEVPMVEVVKPVLTLGAEGVLPRG